MAQDITRTNQAPARANGGGEPTREQPIFLPRADIYETENEIVVLADMPGVSPGDVDITLEQGVLTISGHVPPAVHEGYQSIYAEYGEGDYRRVFTISEDIDQERIRASDKDGVLVLELPKAEPAKPRKIRVEAA